MDEQKTKRIIVSVTVGAVLLAVILLLIMVYQMISIFKHRHDIKELEDKITQYDEMIKSESDMLKIRSTKLWIVRRARELGYIFDTDVPLD